MQQGRWTQVNMVEGSTKILKSFVAKEIISYMILYQEVGGDWKVAVHAIKFILIVVCLFGKYFMYRTYLWIIQPKTRARLNSWMNLFWKSPWSDRSGKHARLLLHQKTVLRWKNLDQKHNAVSMLQYDLSDLKKYSWISKKSGSELQKMLYNCLDLRDLKKYCWISKI